MRVQTKILANGKIDLADTIRNVAKSDGKSTYEDITFSQGMGLMRLRVSPKPMELREKVNLALSKPPMPVKANKMPSSPRCRQKSEIDMSSNDSKCY